MKIPSRLSAVVGSAVPHRPVDLVDSRLLLKQEFAQVAKELAQVVLLPSLNKPRRNRLSKTKTLSEKELEVLRWARAGKTVWEISVIRSVSEATVKFHLRNIYHKLGVNNRAHAVGEAVNRGLV